MKNFNVLLLILAGISMFAGLQAISLFGSKTTDRKTVKSSSLQKVSSDVRITVMNDTGSVTVKTWDKKDEMCIEIVKRGSDKKIAHTEIKQVCKRNSFSLETVVPAGKKACEVDYTLTIPTTANIELLKTYAGEITLKNISTPVVSVHTHCGAIVAKNISHSIDALTNCGAITIEAADVQRSHTIKAVTHCGAITVWLPGGIDANLSAKTNCGSVNTDYPVSAVSRTQKSHVSSALLEGLIGKGGASIELHTFCGAINIKKN